MKILNLFLCFIFLLFAYFQWNDPDSLIWILLYLYIAVISGMAAFQKINQWFILPGIIACVLGIGFLMPGFINWLKMGSPNIAENMKAEQPHIELVREFLGVLISLVVLFYHHYRSVKRNHE